MSAEPKKSNRKWLRKFFSYHDEVVDVFIPQKRNRFGKKF
ncbi:hypothetical protein Golob_006218, partial [Gossypium lobatum]|nr:hypothetical protein [Gossypium lobatum]